MKMTTAGQLLVLELEGELDTATTPAVLDALVAALADAEVSTVVFDLREVSFMDSSAIKILLHAKQHMSGREGQVVVCNARPHVERILTIVGIDQTIALIDGDYVDGQMNAAPESQGSVTR